MALTAPPPPPVPPRPPAIVQPAPYQVSYGIVRGTAAPGTTRLVVRVGGTVVRDVRVRRRAFTFDLDLPVGETSIGVVGVDRAGRRAGRTVAHVFGLPRAARPRVRAPRLDEQLQAAVRRLALGFPGSSAVYVENLATGAGAAWNARATFPAASTLKLAIAVTVLGRLDGPPPPGSSLDRRLRAMLVVSDNQAANDLERLIGGSTSGGSALVNAAMRAIGLERTEMYGGYILGTALGDPPRGLAARGIPLTVVSQPSWGPGKSTTALDLARLGRAIWLASGGLGPLRARGSGVTPAEARYLLYLLARVRDPGKLDRSVGAIRDVAVLHKAGWVKVARHDAGLIVWPGGVLVAAVMTHRPAGAGTASDVLAGRVARAALRRFRG